MEHKLFKSELKPLVDGALVSNIIRSSSSGLNSHRAAAMELVFERSIQELREKVQMRAFTRAIEIQRSRRQPQPKSEAPDIPTPKVQSSTLATASQPQSRPLLSNNTTGTASATSLASASAKCDALQDSSTLSKPTEQAKQGYEELPADVKMNSSPPEVFVELACQKCGVNQPRSNLRCSTNCGLCPLPWYMRCVGCGAFRVDDVDACTSCHGKFK